MQDYFVTRKLAQSPDYEEAYWGTIVDPDGNVRDRLQEREKHLEDIKQELTFLNNLPPGRILDMGCGLGFLLSGLSAEWEKYGVEVSRFAAAWAQQWAKVFVGELEQADYPDEFFDVVVMHHVIEHLHDPIGAILTVHRILKCGGALLLGTPDFDSGCARRFGDRYRLLHDPTHVSLFTNDSMHRFLRDHGFVIDRVEYPFFETRYFTPENLLRLFDTSQVSPPFYGNFMTFYCHKPNRWGVSAAISELARLALKLADSLEAPVELTGKIVLDCLSADGKVLVCGNGGSAADAQHFAAELVGRMSRERLSLPALSLSSDPSVVTALGNDYGYENIFARQIEGLGQAGDVLIAISTSGRSPNILKAVQSAQARGLRTIALVGEHADPALARCDVCIQIPSRNTQRVQELHTAVLHAICGYVETQVTVNKADNAALRDREEKDG
ncbi:SIS domain-containing protein [Anaerolineae bacterium CFX7]|nr:SIS domain-containing protein [Anaerolineae bacterium CFX7]